MLGNALKNVLIVEDDSTLANVFTRILRKVNKDAQIKAHYNGDKALEDLQKNKYDLVISDLCVPRPDNGYNIAKYIRENCPDIEFHLVSGSNDHLYDEALAELGIMIQDKMVFIQKMLKQIH